jgi:hypothetical protein
LPVIYRSYLCQCRVTLHQKLNPFNAPGATSSPSGALLCPITRQTAQKQHKTLQRAAAATAANPPALQKRNARDTVDSKQMLR